MVEAAFEPIWLFETVPQIAHHSEGKTPPEDDSAHLKCELPEYHVLPLIAEEIKEYSWFKCQSSGGTNSDWSV